MVSLLQNAARFTALPPSSYADHYSNINSGPRSAKRAMLIWVMCVCSLSALCQVQSGGLIPEHEPIVYFRENKGQVVDEDGRPRADVLFSGETAGLFFHFTQRGLHYQLARSAEKGEVLELVRVDVEWAGTSPELRVLPRAVLPGHEHFYDCPGSPALSVKRYRSIYYEGLYPGIGLRFFEGEHGGLKYDFLLAPGADYRQIRLSIQGAALSTGTEGGLVLSTPMGEIVEGPLVAHQEGRPVAVSWEIEGQEARIAIHGPYDAGQPLVIDPPVLQWGTYYGGGGHDDARTCTVDSSGCVYLAGGTASMSSIATAGAHQTVLELGASGFLAKFSPSGQRLWATYYGCGPNACVVDADGHVYLAGGSQGGSALATAGAHQEGYGGGPSDACLAKFDSTGLLLWGTYFGGNRTDSGSSCALGPGQSVYLSGSTESVAGIATPGSHQPERDGLQSEAFLAKFDSSGQRLWATYYGGQRTDYGHSCAVDREGGVYLSGQSTSDEAIASPQAHQTVRNGGFDAFLAKFDGSGARQWSTYFGGDGHDVAYACAAADDGAVYLCGEAESQDGMITAGAHQEEHGGGQDAFLAKFGSNGQLSWATYYGGAGADHGHALALAGGQLYMAGKSSSPQGIATPGAHQTIRGFFLDGFLAKFDSTGARLWGTYYGGFFGDGALGCAAGQRGNVYLCGFSNSPSGIATPGSHQTGFGGGEADGFLAKFSDCATRDTLRASACGSFVLNGERYDSSGIYEQLLENSGGCDSVLVLELAVLPVEARQVVEMVCPPEPASTDTLFLQTALGCDSLVVIERVLGRSTAVDTAGVLCAGGTFEFNGRALWAPGLYTDTLPLYGGCDSIVRLTLRETALALDLGGPLRLKLGDSVRLSPLLYGGQAIEWAWSDSSYLSCGQCWAPVLRPLESGRLSLRVWGADGCEAQAELQFELDSRPRVYVPNAFSPNGDGINDYLRLFAGPDVRLVHRFAVYKRWGGLVFEATECQPNDEQARWDGRFRGSSVQAGTYVWQLDVELIDGRRLLWNGEVNLLR